MIDDKAYLKTLRDASKSKYSSRDQRRALRAEIKELKDKIKRDSLVVKGLDPDIKRKRQPLLYVADATLAKIIGNAPLTRGGVTKGLWNYIHAHNLQGDKKKKKGNRIIPDAKLAKVFGTKKEQNMFKMTKLVYKHISRYVEETQKYVVYSSFDVKAGVLKDRYLKMTSERTYELVDKQSEATQSSSKEFLNKLITKFHFKIGGDLEVIPLGEEKIE